jgi:hypothetical protein
MSKKSKMTISKEELVELQTVVHRSNQIQLQIGGLEAQKHELLHSLDTLNNELSIVQKALETKYGDVIVDINTGEFKANEPS